MDNPITWVELINAGGVITVLVLNLYMFASGKIIPSEILNKLTAANSEASSKLATEIKDGIKDAVADGIIAGIFAIREGGESLKDRPRSN